MSPSDPPVVTVIMANYNGAAFIEAALRSLLRQSLSSIEILVADDASTDASPAIVAGITAWDRRVRLLPAATNAGPAAARNRCIEAARGRWLAVVDSDDLLHPDRLARLVTAAERDGADIAADDLLIFDEDGDRAPTACLRGAAARGPFRVDAATYVRANMLFGRAPALGYLKPIVRAELLARTGLRYDPVLRLAEDFDFILRLLMQGAAMRVYPELTYYYRKHGRSTSHRMDKSVLDPLLQASVRFRDTINRGDRAVLDAVDARDASIRRALAFDGIVQAVHARRWSTAVRLAVTKPRAALLLHLPVVARLRRLVRPRRRGLPAPDAGRQVCVISRQRVVGNTNGSSVYLLSLCAALQRSGMQVHLICPSPAVFGRWPVLIMQPETAVFSSIAIRGAVRVGRVFIATNPAIALHAALVLAARPLARIGFAPERFTRPAPYAVALPLARADRLFLARHGRRRADAVVADYAFLTEAIACVLRPDAPSAVVMHDLFSSRSAQFDRLGASDSVALLEEPAEVALLAGADAIVAIQSDEAEWARDRLPDRRVILAPMAVEPVGAPQPGAGARLLFVGSKTAPNVIGLCWFLDAVWPTLVLRAPGVALDVAGSVAAAIDRVPAGVTLLGRVPSLAALYRDAAVVISPLPVGSGLKIKLVEALGHGKAVVGTTPTVQGIEALVGEAVAVADTPEAFAAAVVALLADPALRLRRATAALAIARDHFGAAACYGAFVAFLAGQPIR